MVNENLVGDLTNFNFPYFSFIVRTMSLRKVTGLVDVINNRKQSSNGAAVQHSAIQVRLLMRCTFMLQRYVYSTSYI